LKFTFISSAGVCGRRQILAALVVCVSACLSPVLLAGPVKEAETKVISTSPDGEVEIVTTVPKRDAEYHKEWMERWGSNLEPGVTVICSGLYVRHKRNKGEEWQALEEYKDTGHYKLKVQWHGTSHVFSLFAWDEKDGCERWFVLRLDGRTSRWVYEQPRLPDMGEVILRQTEEKWTALKVPEPIDNPRGELVPVSSGWKGTLSEVKMPDDVSKPIELSFSYFLRNGHGGLLERTHSYGGVFHTMDWTNYELKEMSRYGSLSDAGDESDKVTRTVIFPKKEK